MLFKMLMIERSHQLMGEDMPKPRQIFVTKSRILAKKVEEYFRKLEISLTQASRTLAELLTQPREGNLEEGQRQRLGFPRRFSDIEERHFPLFIAYEDVRFSYFSY